MDERTMEMDDGTRHILNVMHARPAADVAEEWLNTTSRVERAAKEAPVLASREDALQALALGHFDKHYDFDPGIGNEDVEKVHALLEKSLKEVKATHGNALLDCMAGWYLTADRRYRDAVSVALRGR